MRTVSLIILSAVLLAGCGVLPPDNSGEVRITRTIPSGADGTPKTERPRPAADSAPVKSPSRAPLAARAGKPA